MIDLVFVLTNKLEVNVKEIRKTVAENQEVNERKNEEIQRALSDTSRQQDSKIGKFQVELSEMKKKIVDLTSKHERSAQSIEEVEKINCKLQGKLLMLNELRDCSENLNKKFTTSQQHQKNETASLLLKLEQSEKEFSEKIADINSVMSIRVNTIEQDMKVSFDQSAKDQMMFHTLNEEKIKLFEQIAKLQSEQDNFQKSDALHSSHLSKLDLDIMDTAKSNQVLEKKLEHFKELNEGVVNNLKLSIKNTENQIAMQEKSQRNQINFLETKINEKVYTHETQKKADARFQDLELTSNNLKNELKILSMKFSDFKG